MKRPLAIVGLLLLLHILFVVVCIMPWANVLWDEGEFLLQTYLAVRQLESGNIPAFWEQIYRQIAYPSFQYLYLSPILSLAGFSVWTARVAQLLFPVLTGFATYGIGVLAGRAVFGKKSALPVAVGLSSVILFVTSPILIFLHSLALKESMMTTWTVIAVLCYLEARKRERYGLYLAAGVSLALSFLTKYPFAILSLGALGIEGLIALLTAKSAKLRVRVVITHLLLVLPPLLAAIGWVTTTPERWHEFLRVLDNKQIPDLMLGWGPETYLPFYPRGIVYLFGMTMPVGLLLLLSYIMGILFIAKREMRLLFTSLAINLAVLVPHFNNMQERYIAPNTPFLFVIASVVIADFVLRIKKSTSVGVPVLKAAAGAILLHALISLPGFPNWVFAVGNKTIYALEFNQLDARIKWFDYDTKDWGMLHPKESKERPDDMIAWILPRIDATKPVYQRGRLTEMSPPYFALTMLYHKDHDKPKNLPYSSYNIGFTVLPQSRYNHYEYRKLNAWVQWEVAADAADPALTKIDEKLFPEMGINVVIYGRK